MTLEVVTLIAAIIAALTSIGSLVLNTRLAIQKEQRMLLSEKELERLLELEELAGTAQELALSHASPDVLEAEFKPIRDKLRRSAGRFGRYPELAKAIRELNRCCAVTVTEKIARGDSREWQEKVKPAFQRFIHQSDLVTRRS